MLIVLRGNSGSGKTSTAKLLREAALLNDSQRKIALIEQDYIRRTILKEKESEGTDNIDLIFETVAFALEREYVVVLEGILFSKRYKDMLTKLRGLSVSNYFYYFDISLTETLNRHAQKSNAHEFGEEEMTEWYVHRDVLDFENETLIEEGTSQKQALDLILEDTGL